MDTTRHEKLSVFLSYRSVEAPFADELKQHLRHDFIGLIEVFLASDTTSIPAGTRWHSDVLEGLRHADLHIVICSKASVICPWINYEAGAAAVRDIPVVPLCHSGLRPDQLPVPLSEREGGVITDPAALERLYVAIAGLIGSDVPAVDFIAYSREFTAIQEKLESLVQSVKVASVASHDGNVGPDADLIRNPRVVCVTSSQFRELGYANQLETVLGAFPQNITHEYALNSADLKRLLLNGRVDIVHIAAFVCPRGGDLYFTPVQLPLGASDVKDPDIITPEVLVSLLQRSGTRLVVLGASASLVLGAQLLEVTNVIAVRDMVSPKAMASWIQEFYTTLVKEPLTKAFELATAVSEAPMMLYAQQRQAPLMTVRISGGIAAAAFTTSVGRSMESVESQASSSA